MATGKRQNFNSKYPGREVSLKNHGEIVYASEAGNLSQILGVDAYQCINETKAKFSEDS